MNEFIFEFEFESEIFVHFPGQKDTRRTSTIHF